ncbi:MAG: Crp/Fnr family transcriptional regulator [Schleiferiaceae bacterium]|jgi:CRP-like cAMP-binding protein|nr:Crp/Fnr family transcriptional regulator [Schleiferiaceae bacterium]
MQDKLIHYFSKNTPLTPEEEKVLVDSMTIKQYKKGELVVEEGQRSLESFFVLQGLVRQFKWVDGEDKTTNFFTEEQWIISSHDTTGNAIAEDNLICMEDTALVTGDEEKAVQLFQKFPRFESISRQIVEASFREQQTLMASYITDKPEQRYLNLMKNRPDVLQRVPQYDIATFIGVKPESLSRIRKKLHNKS